MKRFIKQLFSALGYDIIKINPNIPSNRLLYNNFRSLVDAYEEQLNKINKYHLRPNPLRTKLLARLRGTPPAEAYYILYALMETANIEGDVCEFGVAQGETSALVANELLHSQKRFHLFDSFQGLSDPSTEDELIDDIFSLGDMKLYKGTMSFTKEMVIARLDDIQLPKERYVIHEGFIDQVIMKEIDLPAEVSFAYIDFDLYSPIRTTLSYLHGILNRGAILIVDDYGYFSKGVKVAVDEFINAHPDYDLTIPDPIFGHFAIIKKN